MKRGLSFDQFKNYYDEKKRLPFGIYTPSKQLNEKQIQTKYERYTKSEERKTQKQSEKKKIKKEIKKDTRWQEVREKVFAEKGKQCWYLKTLSSEQIEQLEQRAGNFIYIVDPAHVLPKDKYPELKYDPDNIIPLNRYSHHCLDFSLHPITGEKISRVQKALFWVDIIGEKQYHMLLDKIQKLRNVEEMI